MEHRVKPHVNMWKGDLRICNKKIDADNINEILKNNCNYEIDVFSLDIDSIDYWIIDKLQQNISKIFPEYFQNISMIFPSRSKTSKDILDVSYILFALRRAQPFGTQPGYT